MEEPDGLGVHDVVNGKGGEDHVYRVDVAVTGDILDECHDTASVQRVVLEHQVKSSVGLAHGEGYDVRIVRAGYLSRFGRDGGVE